MWILQGFFAVLVIVLAVVFQEDLRRFFEQLAVWSLRRRAAALPPASEATGVSLKNVRQASNFFFGAHELT